MEQIIARDIHRMAEIQQEMEHGHSFIPGHVDLIEYPEAPFHRTLVHRSRPEFHFSVFEGVRAQHPGGIHVDVEGNVPHRPSEYDSQVLCQHVLPGSFRTCQQQVLSAQQGRNSLFPHIFPVIMEMRDRDTGLEFRRCRKLFPIIFHALDQIRADFLFF